MCVYVCACACVYVCMYVYIHMYVCYACVNEYIIILFEIDLKWQKKEKR